MKKFYISHDSSVVNKQIVDIRFPENAMISLIKRNNEYLTPTGATVIQAGDALVVLADNDESLQDVMVCLGKDIDSDSQIHS